MINRFLLYFLISFSTYNVAAQSLKTKLTDHSSNIETVCVSGDGKYLATGAWDGKINLYTFDSAGVPQIKEIYKGHMGAVISLSFSPNNKYLVSGSKDYSSRIWNLDTPANHQVFNLHLEPVTASFLDPSYKFLISSSLDGTIRFTNIRGKIKSRVIKLNAPIYDLLLSRDRKHYYVALKGAIIKKIETAGQNAEVLSFIGHTDDINAIEFSPDGKTIASASNDKTIQIWDVMTGKSLKILNGFEWKVTSLKFTTDGKYIVGGCNNGVSKLFEVETGKNISDFNEIGKNVRDVTFSKDGQQIIVATLLDDTITYGAIIYNSGVISSVTTTTTTANNKKTTTTTANKKKTNGAK